MNYEKLHDYCFENRVWIEKSSMCGCFYCLSTFSASTIIEWCDDDENDIGMTALCPHCGIDSVLGDTTIEITEQMLKDMRDKWFSPIVFKS